MQGLRQRIAFNSFTLSWSVSCAVMLVCPMQFSAETIGGSLAAPCGAARFRALSVFIENVPRSLGMNDCVSAAIIHLLLRHGEGLVCPLTLNTEARSRLPWV